VAAPETTVEVGEVDEMGNWVSSCLKDKQSFAKAGSMLRTELDDTVDGRARKEKETKRRMDNSERGLLVNKRSVFFCGFSLLGTKVDSIN
jgi:hypothetical protein